MEKFIETIKKYNIIEILIITGSVILCAALFGTTSFQILSDRGREFILAQGILEGNVPFKDIFLLYSPLTYYINAVFMLIFGSTINSLLIAATICSIIFAVTYYLLVKEFTEKSLSFWITLLVVFTCISGCSIFKYLFPYSYSMVYGITSSILATYFLVKFLKNSNAKFAYISGLFAGLAFAFKLEFLPILLIFVGYIALNKSIDLKSKILSYFYAILMPVITFLLPLIQGAKISDYIEYLNFFTRFSNTQSMRSFYGDIGAIFNLANIPLYQKGIFGLMTVLILVGITFVIFRKTNKKFIFPIMFCLIIYLMFTTMKPFNHSILLPFATLVLFIIKFKDIKNNPTELLIVLTAFALSIRCFFLMRMNLHGVYALPVMIIALYILIEKFTTAKNLLTEQNKIFKFITCIYLTFFVIMNLITSISCNSRLLTNKGTIYIPKEQTEILNKTIDFINQNTQKSDKILFLPEGQIINFITDRKCDLKLHMLDRLYYEGLGEAKSLELLQNSNNDYIIIAKGFSLSNFSQSYLFTENNKLTQYISENYRQIEFFGNKNHQIFIFQKQ